MVRDSRRSRERGQSKRFACSGPGGRRREVLPSGLPSDASVADRSFGSRDGRARASTAGCFYDFLRSEVRSLESPTVGPRPLVGPRGELLAACRCVGIRPIQRRFGPYLLWRGFCVRPLRRLAASSCGSFARALVRSQRRFVLDEEFRLGRPRLVRLSRGQQAEAVELLARLFLDAARLEEQTKRCGRTAARLRRASPNPGRRRTP